MPPSSVYCDVSLEAKFKGLPVKFLNFNCDIYRYLRRSYVAGIGYQPPVRLTDFEYLVEYLRRNIVECRREWNSDEHVKYLFVRPSIVEVAYKNALYMIDDSEAVVDDEDRGVIEDLTAMLTRKIVDSLTAEDIEKPRTVVIDDPVTWKPNPHYCIADAEHRRINEDIVDWSGIDFKMSVLRHLYGCHKDFINNEMVRIS